VWTPLGKSGRLGETGRMIDRLELLIALVHERHFGRAAERLGITQPSLSSGIKQLEESLGVQLVRRGARFEGLTPEGERVYARALRLVADARDLREEMRAVRLGITGELRIGVIPTALPMVADLTVPFHARHPAVKISLLSRSSTEIADQIDRLELEAGITYLGLSTARFRQVTLYRERYSLLLAESAPEPKGRVLTWAQAGTLPLCLLTPDMQNRRIIDARLARAGVPADPRIEANSMIALLAHVATGRWAAVVPRALAAGSARLGAFRSLSILDDAEETASAPSLVGLVTAPREPAMPMVAALVARAEALARTAPYAETIDTGNGATEIPD
jgi:DNA-binding transcriptional LysR family regulator